MNEGRAREQIERGEKAASLLRNDLLNEAFEALEADFIQAWKVSSVEDSQNRERLYMLCQNLSALRGYLEGVITSGKLAKAQLDELQNRQKFEKR
ncbi:hypothetical protein FAMCQIZV_CDS0018 [Phage C72C1]|jgi:hypothetical protein|nr:hypothetical protein FAMCQIZV_CDS0018 [Phage C72C1]